LSYKFQAGITITSHKVVQDLLKRANSSDLIQDVIVFLDEADKLKGIKEAKFLKDAKFFYGFTATITSDIA
jgi:hypothetical protein